MQVADVRLGSWAQREARRHHLALLRERRGPLTALSVLVVVAAVLGVLATPNRLTAFAAGAAAASVGWYAAMLVVIQAGTALKLLGSSGEGLTADVLRRRRRWHPINNVPLEWCDVDHVVVGCAGVIAIETKSTSTAWNVDEPHRWLVEATCQARYGAERIRKLLLKDDTRVRTPVQPALVVWGPLEGTARMVDGVAVLHGRELKGWLDRQSAPVLTADEVQRAIHGLEQFVAMRERDLRQQHEEQHGRMAAVVEFGPGALLGQVGRGLAGSAIALFTLALLVQVLPRAAVVPLLVASMTVGLMAFRSTRLRLLALGWLSFAGGLIAVTVALSAWVWLVQ